MRVLQVIPSMATSTGGPAAVVAGLSKALVECRCLVTIASTDLATPAQATQACGKVSKNQLPPEARDLDLRLFPVSHPVRWAYSKGLGEYLHLHVREYDIVHIHSLNLHTQFTAYRQCRRFGLPYIVTLHGTLDPYIQSRSKLRRMAVTKLWQQQMLDSAGSLHFGSSDERDRARSYFSNDRTTVIPNGISLHYIESQCCKFVPRTLGTDSSPLVVNHGRLTEKKGLDLLIRAVADARRHIPRLRLALIGPDDDAMSARLQEIARQCGISDAVSFLGPIYGSQLFDTLRTADLWVLPSWSEGASVAVNEALALGLPTIVSPHVSTAQDGANADALKVVDNSPDILANEIVALLEDFPRRCELQVNARRYAAGLSWSAVAPRYVDMYEMAITSSRS